MEEWHICGICREIELTCPREDPCDRFNRCFIHVCSACLPTWRQATDKAGRQVVGHARRCGLRGTLGNWQEHALRLAWEAHAAKVEPKI